MEEVMYWLDFQLRNFPDDRGDRAFEVKRMVCLTRQEAMDSMRFLGH